MRILRYISNILRIAFAVAFATAIMLTLSACAFVPNADPEDGKAPGQAETPTPPAEPPSPATPPLWKSTFTLPNAEDAKARLVEIYGGADKVFLLQYDTAARMPCPQSEIISLNLTYEVNEYAKLILEDSVAEFNEVFAVINPNYTFTINYAPTEKDFEAQYSVRMKKADSLSQSNTGEVFGIAHVGYYNGFADLGGFGITMRSDVFDNGGYLMATFKHELMHLLGAGDAYNNKKATKATIMQSYTVNGYHGLSSTDVAMLDALYRNPECPYSAEYIAKYIDEYEAKSTHTKAALTSAVYNHMIDKLDGKSLLDESAAIGYADLSGLTAAVANGITRDKTFGSYGVAFTELTYTVKPEATYFGSFDPENKIYRHGKQTTLGSSQGIKYTDYGDGLLYAAPNGNLYTLFIRIDEYVVLLTLHGGFTSLPTLSITVWHVCSVNG